MLHTRFIKISSKKQFKLYDKFANENWGEHSNDGDIKLDFFAVPNYAGCLYQNSRKVSSLFIFIRNIEVDNNRYIIAVD